MAAITATAATPSTAVRGLGKSSLAGQKLPKASHSMRMHKTSKRGAGVAVAKYGDKSVYFDLEDIGNTTGAWDLYGSDAPSPYNSLQSKFFETFAGPFKKRGLLLKFLLLAGGGALAYASANATPDILPIKKGPQKPPTLGPRGKI
uniref:TSA: Wollemia nobilis Ref_Wollemi_Transcript_22392_956 transcribed RNA sequence n=1 Tax=Wollemia nobilis TaxID=56998 RepID=A0A0C9RH90_9CONI